jgi:hypothetical protein
MEEVVPCADFALGLGDLVYDNGAASDFDPLLFRPYAELFRRMAFWRRSATTTPGDSNGAPFYDAFYLPTNTARAGQSVEHRALLLLRPRHGALRVSRQRDLGQQPG